MNSIEVSKEITPIDKLFTYDIFGFPRYLDIWQDDPATYFLELNGCNGKGIRFSLADIKEMFEPVKALVILQCMTNIHWGKVQVKGARILDILKRSGIDINTLKVGFEGGDGFSTDLFMEEIISDPDKYLLAYEMNW